MPQVAEVQPARKRQMPAVLPWVGACVLGLAVAGLAWWWLTLPSAAKVVQQADALDEQGHYDEAFAKLQSAYGRMLSSSDKALIVSRLAATKADMGDNAAAVGYYQQLNQLQPNNYANLVMLGDTAYDAGNKPVALSAYKQALVLLKTQTGPLTGAEYSRMSGRIAELSK